MIKSLNQQSFDILDRITLLEEIGFKKCIYVDEDGNKHSVRSIGAPNQGYKTSELINMTDNDFIDLISWYVN